jgi:hypothetical protein
MAMPSSCASRRAPAAGRWSNLLDNQRIAVTLVTPTTYRSMQVKGRAQGGLALTADDLAVVERHRAAFVREVEAVGVPLALGPRLYQAELDLSSMLAGRFASRSCHSPPGAAAVSEL